MQKMKLLAIIENLKLKYFVNLGILWAEPGDYTYFLYSSYSSSSSSRRKVSEKKCPSPVQKAAVRPG